MKENIVFKKCTIEIDLTELIKEQNTKESPLHIILQTNINNCHPILRLNVRTWDSTITPPDSWRNSIYERKNSASSISTSWNTSSSLSSAKISTTTPRGERTPRGISETHLTVSSSELSPIKERREDSLYGSANHSERSSLGSDDDAPYKSKVSQSNPLVLDEKEKSLTVSLSPSINSISSILLSKDLLQPPPSSMPTSSTVASVSPSSSSAMSLLAPPCSSHTTTRYRIRATSDCEADLSDDEDKDNQMLTPKGGCRIKRGFSRFQLVPDSSSESSTNGVQLSENTVERTSETPRPKMKKKIF